METFLLKPNVTFSSFTFNSNSVVETIIVFMILNASRNSVLQIYIDNDSLCCQVMFDSHFLSLEKFILSFWLSALHLTPLTSFFSLFWVVGFLIDVFDHLF